MEEEEETNLFGEKFFAERVESDEFAGKETSIGETFGDHHDFTDQIEIGHDHGARI